MAKLSSFSVKSLLCLGSLLLALVLTTWDSWEAGIHLNCFIVVFGITIHCFSQRPTLLYFHCIICGKFPSSSSSLSSPSSASSSSSSASPCPRCASPSSPPSYCSDGSQPEPTGTTFFGNLKKSECQGFEINLCFIDNLKVEERIRIFSSLIVLFCI